MGIGPSLAGLAPRGARPQAVQLADDCQGLLCLLWRQRLAVMVGVMNDVGNRIALFRVGDNHTGPALRLCSLLKGGHYLLEVVAIDILGEPPKRFPARRQR